MQGFSPLDDQESKHQEERDRIMNTLGIINNGPVNLEQSNPIGTQNEQTIANEPFEGQTNVQNPQVNTMEQPPSNTMSKEYVELLDEFSKFRKEVKMCIQAFNQNIYELQQEVVSLKSGQQQVQQPNVQGTLPPHTTNTMQTQAQQPVQNIQQQTEVCQPVESENHFVQQNNTTFTSSQQNVAQTDQVQSRPVQQATSSHPRTGDFSPDDVKIENIFYCGNR
jgi:hypothetical protein